LNKVLHSDIVGRAYRDKKAELAQELNLDPTSLPVTLSRTRIQQLSVLSLSRASGRKLGLDPILEFSNVQEDSNPVPVAFYEQLCGKVLEDGLEVTHHGELWTVLCLEPYDSRSQTAVRPGDVIYVVFRFDAVRLAPARLVENDL